ncbi:MAG TPA: DUF1223 domain-containing protein [Kofleriaceae bacterium]|nr:DUF1223 domain-containing protein [Kofleriaceae bacterium]
MRLLDCLVLANCVLLGCATAASGETRVEPDQAPLVVELFTSQGCSSCPPADALLNKLAHDGKLAGRPLAPLAFHVDYWDDLGWADPYALPAWSERQRQYARALGDDRVYTPELVVGGRAGMVGSDSTRAHKAIAAAPTQQKLTATASWSAKTVTIEATAPADADVLVAIYQDGTKTKVPRGENAGETLAADRVVRRLERVAPAGKTGKLTLPLDERWGAIGAIAFAQRADRAIVGSALLSR